MALPQNTPVPLDSMASLWGEIRSTLCQLSDATTAALSLRLIPTVSAPGSIAAPVTITSATTVMRHALKRITCTGLLPTSSKP